MQYKFLRINSDVSLEEDTYKDNTISITTLVVQRSQSYESFFK